MTGREARLAPAQVREHAAVLERVVPGDDPAVGRAVDAEGPVVLADRHAVEERADVARVDVAGGELGDELAQPVELAAQVVVDVDEVLARGLLVGPVAGVGIGRRARRGGWPRPTGRGRSGARPAGSGRRRTGARRRAPPRRAAPPAPARSPERSRSTSSRTAGAVSSAKRRIAASSSTARMNVLMPCSTVSPAISSALDRAREVVEAPDLDRVPPRVHRRRVDGRVHRTEVLRVRVAHARHPAVRLPPGQREHPRLVGAQPDLDVVQRRRPVLLPRGADDRQRRLQRGHALARASAAARPSARPRPRTRPTRARAAPARWRARPASRRSWRASPPAGAAAGSRRWARAGRARSDAGDVGQQRPRVQELRLVRVVLEGDDVQPRDVGRARELDDRAGVGGRRRDEDAELQDLAVVRQDAPPGPGRCGTGTAPARATAGRTSTRRSCRPRTAGRRPRRRSRPG